MNLSKTFAITLVGFGITVSGYSQTFNIVRQVAPTDASGDFSFHIGQGTLTETVTIDPVALTIRQVGSLSLPGFGASAQSVRHITTTYPPVFPNPVGRTVSGDLTLNLSASGPQTASFDRTDHFASNGTFWRFNNTVYTINVAATLSYSLTTDNQTYTGTPSINIGIGYDLGSYFGTANYPTSIDMGPSGMSVQPGLLWDFTAPNGLHATAISAPEPTSIGLFGLGSLVLVLLGRGRKLTHRR
jgi:hypothetical protein